MRSGATTAACLTARQTGTRHDARPMTWHIRGTYFESCNCDAICPCRRIDGVPGGRSTHGICLGVLSWLIEEGAADGTDLSGIPVAIASRYSDDEPGSPWTWILYLDARASAQQRTALEEIYAGRRGGDAERHFPWAWKPSELVAVRPVDIDVDHTRRRQFLRVRDHDAFGRERDEDGLAGMGWTTPAPSKPPAKPAAAPARTAPRAPVGPARAPAAPPVSVGLGDGPKRGRVGCLAVVVAFVVIGVA